MIRSVESSKVFTLSSQNDINNLPEDPKVFISERHAVKRHPVAWMPFGVGMRFALMELKICLIRLLQQYRILLGDKIEEGFKQHEIFVIEPNAIFIKLEKRSS